jgi:branched-chain amino acid transport system permease protein
MTRYFLPGLILVVALLLPLVLGPYGNFLLATLLVYSLVALGFTILMGMAGQISIGQVGFWALGAYASALCVVKLNLPFVAGVCAGGIIGALAGAIVALPALRVQGHYLAIATLAFAFLVERGLFEWESLTGGRQGLAVPRPEIAGITLAEDQTYVYMLLGIVLLFVWMISNLRRSHTGQALLALKMSTTAAEAAGINRASHLILAFALSGFCTGVSGALYGHLIGFLSTETFTLGASLSFLTMAVIGGLQTATGAVLGAAYLTLAPEILRELKSAQMVIYGVSLILCMRFLPGGLESLFGRVATLWKKRP